MVATARPPSASVPGSLAQPSPFSVRVPKDFGEQKLTWTLIAHGQTAQVAGTLKPVWMIDRLRTTRGGSSEHSDAAASYQNIDPQAGAAATWGLFGTTRPPDISGRNHVKFLSRL